MDWELLRVLHEVNLSGSRQLIFRHTRVVPQVPGSEKGEDLCMTPCRVLQNLP